MSKPAPAPAPAFAGRLYRALNPVWACQPLSGEGAARFGGRFNPVGTPALYCSLSPLTALREANQAGDLQPTVLVCYRARIERVFDTRDPAALNSAGSSESELADPGWREAMRRGEAPTQRLAGRLVAAGFDALLVQSFARGAGPGDLNLVLWRWGGSGRSGGGGGAMLEVVDDEGRLGRLVPG